jgi:hypothetical protein
MNNQSRGTRPPRIQPAALAYGCSRVAAEGASFVVPKTATKPADRQDERGAKRKAQRKARKITRNA